MGIVGTCSFPVLFHFQGGCDNFNPGKITAWAVGFGSYHLSRFSRNLCNFLANFPKYMYVYIYK